MKRFRPRALVAGAVLIGLTSCGGAPRSSQADAVEISATAPGSAAADAAAVAPAELTVVGEGHATATPDTARVVLGVEVVRPDVEAGFDEAARAAQAVLEALQAAGIEEQDIRTVEVSVRERREPPTEPGGDPPEVSGYAVTNLVQVTVRDVDRAGEVIAAAVDAGGEAARVQHLEMVVEQNAAQLEAARRAAFADAVQRAEQYATTAGQNLGSLVAISEVLGPASTPSGAGQEARVGGVVPPPLAPGQQELIVRIQATWQLE